jgi:hypothetical protein
MWVELQPSALRLRHPPKSKADGRVLGLSTTTAGCHGCKHHSPRIRIRLGLLRGIMDAAIDLSDASKALDLANIRFQLMYPMPTPSAPEPS